MKCVYDVRRKWVSRREPHSMYSRQYLKCSSTAADKLLDQLIIELCEAVYIEIDVNIIELAPLFPGDDAARF